MQVEMNEFFQNYMDERTEAFENVDEADKAKFLGAFF